MKKFFFSASEYAQFQVRDQNVLLSIDIARFINLQRFWRETISVLDFLYGDSYQWKTACKSTATG